MMWLSRQERSTLTVIGAAALIGLGVLAWQRQRPALTIEGTPRAPSAAPWDAALANARQVDINTADVAELERLPRVGPVLAGRIVAYRTVHGPFHSTEELLHVRGIGPQTCHLLAEHVTVH